MNACFVGVGGERPLPGVRAMVADDAAHHRSGAGLGGRLGAPGLVATGPATAGTVAPASHGFAGREPTMRRFRKCEDAFS
jgi:hypothetical protein